jgi:hypothetical protein
MFTSADLPVPTDTLWGFVALQYHTLILNRIVVVCVGRESVVVLVGGGLVVSPHVATARMHDPNSWVRRGKLSKYPTLNFEDDAVLHVARANFRMPFTTMGSIEYSAAKKWGMGSVPYSGRVFIKTADDQREFILIGNENGEAVRDRLTSAKLGA